MTVTVTHVVVNNQLQVLGDENKVDTAKAELGDAQEDLDDFTKKHENN